MYFRKFWLACAFFLFAPLALSQPLPVVASFSILADMVREVGGSHVAVSALVGPNADSHIFDPTPADAKRIASARLVVVNGLGFEGWLDRLVKASGYRGSIVIASQGIEPSLVSQEAHSHTNNAQEHRHAHPQGASDPHAWQSLTNAERYVRTICLALAAALPEQAFVFEQNANDYIQRMKALDQTITMRIAEVPPDRRRVIVSHDAFGYFAAAYGVKFYSLQGMSTGSEPSAAEIVRIVDQIKKNKVSAIFTENISDPRALARIAKDSGASIGGVLYADALTEPGTAADTYLKMFEHNALTIVRGISASSSK